jgi:hypothetical protein
LTITTFGSTEITSAVIASLMHFLAREAFFEERGEAVFE